MEPFISADGSYLFFNTSNVAPSIPALQFAARVGGDSFQYEGAVAGANQTALPVGNTVHGREKELVLRLDP